MGIQNRNIQNLERTTHKIVWLKVAFARGLKMFIKTNRSLGNFSEYQLGEIFKMARKRSSTKKVKHLEEDLK